MVRPAGLHEAGHAEAFGWNRAVIAPGRPAFLTFDAATGFPGDALFRIHLGGPVAEAVLLRVTVGCGSAATRSEIPVPACRSFQMVALPLAAEEVRQALVDGIELTLAPTGETAGNADLSILVKRPSGETAPAVLLPTLASAHLPWSRPQWFRKLCSPAVVAPFGFAFGLVLAALHRMHTQVADSRIDAALDWLIDRYLDDQEGVIYTASDGAPRYGSLENAGCALPFATILRRKPKHEAAAVLRHYCETRCDPDGLIADRFCDAGGAIVHDMNTRDAFALALPLGVLAGHLRDNSLRQWACDQIRLREGLPHTIWLSAATAVLDDTPMPQTVNGFDQALVEKLADGWCANRSGDGFLGSLEMMALEGWSGFFHGLSSARK